MALILNIDTATEVASICLSEKNKVLSLMINKDQKDHAAWIHNAIADILLKSGKKIKELDAVSVTGGPGSYTGLRVGMATAKGICFTLNKPLIIENTLMVMAEAGKRWMNSKEKPEVWNGFLLSPMIDARRMEVYTAIYNLSLDEIVTPTAMNLDAFLSIIDGRSQYLVFGNGSEKLKQLNIPEGIIIESIYHDSSCLSPLSYQSFCENRFADLAYSEPAYLKEFYSPAKKNTEVSIKKDQ